MQQCEYKPCGKPFDPVREWQRYCSERCRMQAHADERAAQQMILAAARLWYDRRGDFDATEVLKLAIRENRQD